MNKLKTNDELFGIKGVRRLFTKDEKKGKAQIIRYSFEESKDFLYNLRAVRDGHSFMVMYDGDYVKLLVGNELVMSDTWMERNTNRDFINTAHGNILIAGLGLGMVLLNILDKPDVVSVTVVELEQDVIDLVAPKFKHPKLRVVQGDIHKWKPKKDVKYDCIYFDIWPNMSVDNLEDMKVLHKGFRRYLNKDNSNAFMDSWPRKILLREKRRERRNNSN